MPENEVERYQEAQIVRAVNAPMTIGEIVGRRKFIHEIMKEVMVKDTHFGTIPGCGDKPALFKAGAETLSMTFRLCPEYRVEQTDLPGGHREYKIVCRIVGANGVFLGEGVGLCTSMESKYRYRKNAAKFSPLEEAIPKDYKEKKADYRKRGFGCQKVNDIWTWGKYEGGDTERIENPDISDTFNTVLKMAKKRAFVDAVLTTTSASDIFTQDIEESLIDPETGEIISKPPVAKPQRKSENAPATQEPPKSNGNGGNVISEAQKKRFYAIYKSACVTDEEAKAYLKETHGIEHSKDIPKDKYEEICVWAQEQGQGS